MYVVSTHRRLCQEPLDCVEPHEINFKHVSAGFDQVLLAKAVFATPEGVKSGRSEFFFKNQNSWYVYDLWPNINRVLLTRPEKSSLTCSVFFAKKNPIRE